MTKPRVLIVGGGPVGLVAGLFLHHFDIPFLLIEKDEQDSILPRARGWHVRTLEILRQAGAEDAAQAAAKSAWQQGSFGGARRGTTMLDAVALAMPTLEAAMQRMAETDPSPSAFCACPQSLLDPVLWQRLMARGADLRRGHELVAMTQDNEGVMARLRDKQGNETELSVDYVIGADGSRSVVRSLLGIQSSKTPAERHYLNLFFRADLADAVRERTFSQCEIANPHVRGLFASKNNTDEWSFHLKYDPAGADPNALTDAELIALLRAAIGHPTVAIEILARTSWNTSVRVAQTYQSGRVFLAGDAAHTMPPWGGFNGNTGIADAHNLAWKLAAVIHGEADTGLLASYTRERRPVAVRNGKQALLRTDFDARFEISTEANHAIVGQLQDFGTLLLRHRYGTDTGLPTTDEGLVDHLHGQPGTRFPHAWIEKEGQRMSTLDLFGKSYVVLQGPACREPPEPQASPTPVMGRRIYKAGVDFSFCDDGVSWSSLAGCTDEQSVLVRPDGFVSYRGENIA